MTAKPPAIPISMPDPRSYRLPTKPVLSLYDVAWIAKKMFPGNRGAAKKFVPQLFHDPKAGIKEWLETYHKMVFLAREAVDANSRTKRVFVFSRLLARMLEHWEKDGETLKVGCAWDMSFHLVSVFGFIDYLRLLIGKIPSPAMLEKDGTNDWAYVEWAFPDQVIADVMGVARQAVNAKRHRLARGRKLEVSGEEVLRCDREEAAMKLTEETSLPYPLVRRFVWLPLATALSALDFLPNGPEEDMDKAVAAMRDRYGEGLVDTLTYVAARKGLLGPTAKQDALRLLVTALPGETGSDDEPVAVNTGFTPGFVGELRKIPRSRWEPVLARIPNIGIHDDVDSGDSIIDVVISKGVDDCTAARLLATVIERERRKTLESLSGGSGE